MEGVNIGAILLGYVAILLFAVVSLMALVLMIARKTRGARIVMASGLLSATAIIALAALSFLQPGMGFHIEGQELDIVVAAFTLLVAGIGPFIAAVRRAGYYGAATGFSVASLFFLASPFLGSDVLGLTGAAQILSIRNPLLPPLSLGVTAGFALAVSSLVMALVPQRRTDIFGTSAGERWSCSS